MLFIGIFLVNVTKASAYRFFLHAAITWGTQAYDKKKKLLELLTVFLALIIFLSSKRKCQQVSRDIDRAMLFTDELDEKCMSLLQRGKREKMVCQAL